MSESVRVPYYADNTVGTGKTFLGVSLAQAILSSQTGQPQPILVASQTNRACDDFLSDLKKKGISKIVRLGGGSKEDWTRPHMLREVSSKMRLTGTERHDVREARANTEHLARDGLGWAESLSKDMLGWYTLKDHIKERHSNIFDHFASLEHVDTDVTDLRRAKKYSGFAYEFWLSGGDIKDMDSLLEALDIMLGNCELTNQSQSSSIEFKRRIFAGVKTNTEVAAADTDGEQIWSLSIAERQSLVASWLRELNPWKVCEAFAEVHRRHRAAITRKIQAFQVIDARCLAQQQVIGLTTTGVARYWELLNQLKLKVVITEEASECLESHTVCSLFNSVEHALFIGDPLQLRPQVNTTILSTEHCTKYRLDESLFERMMFSKSPISVSRLNVQRRMHPDIADLSRAGDYGYLLDHESTLSNPPVVGMVDRVYWLDHRQPEDRPDPRLPISKSHSNQYEVEFCAALVRYLIERGGYSLGEIVVLTPYNGQLAALTTRLQETCSIWLSDKDRDALIDTGLIPIGDSRVATSKTSIDLSSMLKIVTVDNFQGEEAKVIIFSAVRSNMYGKVGFLRTRNRINVACSRARDGFYILGDASLIGSIEHWAKRIDVLREKNLIGRSFRTCCSRHPKYIHEVYEPEGFQRVPRCLVPCHENLACSHFCKENCHPLAMHDDGRVPCSAACERALDCGHPCPRTCSERCGGCTYKLPWVELGCGHRHVPSCSELAEGKSFQCKLIIDHQNLPCGHTKNVLCSEFGKTITCEELCGVILSCGHACTALCLICSEQGVHAQCTSLCGASLSCGHACDMNCHPDKCPLCSQQCSKSCQHGPCELACSQFCNPCTLPCGRGGCAHQNPCAMICSIPCDRLPCSEPCLKFLACGLHVCPSLCSETCISVCTQCKTGMFQEDHQIQLSCGHVLGVETLDILWGIRDLYEVDPTGTITSGGMNKLLTCGHLRCPDCWQVVDNVERYDLANQLQELPSTLDSFYAKIAKKLSLIAGDIIRTEEFLRRTFAGFCKKLQSGPLGSRHNQRLLWDRGNAMLESQQKTVKFRDEIVRAFEENVQRLALFLNNPGFFNHMVFPFKLRYDLIHYQCRFITLEDCLKTLRYLQALDQLDQHTSIITEGLRVKVLDESLGQVTSMEEQITDATALNLKRVEVELRIIQARLHMIVKSLGTDSGLDTSASLQRMRELCLQFPNSAGKLLGTYQAVRAHIEGGPAPTSSMELYTRASHELLPLLGKHKEGNLQYCVYRHPFCSVNFTECPECGREEAPLNSGPRVDPSKLLQEDAFLAHFGIIRGNVGA